MRIANLLLVVVGITRRMSYLDGFYVQLCKGGNRPEEEVQPEFDPTTPSYF